MKVIIVGCGKVGSTVANYLSLEKHNIIVVDKIEERINAVTNNVDCMGVVGNGAIQSVLIEAEVDSADFLIACTSSDEINILTCLIARKCSKCRTIARIRNPEYAKQINYIMNELDISITINPELATANEILNNIRYSSSLSSDSFFKGRLNLLNVEVPKDSRIHGLRLFEIIRNFSANVLVCAIQRNNEVFVPSGATVVYSGDKLCFVADHQNAITFFSAMGYPYKQLNSFMIIGAGKITKYLIENLLKSNRNYKIKVIDKDSKACEEIANLFPNISVVCADATDKNLLIREGMTEVDSFITLTGIDEANIILSLFARQNNNTKAITKINHLNFIDSLNGLEIGSIVNPERIASNIIVSYLRAANNAKGSNNVESLYRLFDDRIEALGFKIKKESNITNIQIKNLKIKSNIIIAGIYRNSNVIIPNGDEHFQIGDSVVVISNGHTLNDLTDILV